MSKDELTTSRRRIARLGFRTPRPARFGTHDAVVLDISLHGAGIRHPGPIKLGTEAMLRFRLEKQEHAMRCRVVRSRMELQQHEDGTVQSYRSGLAFVGLEHEAVSFREALRKRANRAILLQQANALARPELASGESASDRIELEFLAPWLKPKPFVRYTLERGRKWKTVRVSRAEQPDNGFTILAEEAEKEVATLCRLFEDGSAEQRHLIQLFAHLSLTETSGS
ncbi:MAG: PilZ domain-containing protein [Thermoanaerobaculia bacterium]